MKSAYTKLAPWLIAEHASPTSSSNCWMNPARLTVRAVHLEDVPHGPPVAFSRLRLSNVNRRAAGAGRTRSNHRDWRTCDERAIRERRFALDDAVQLLLLVPELDALTAASLRLDGDERARGAAAVGVPLGARRGQPSQSRTPLAASNPPPSSSPSASPSGLHMRWTSALRLAAAAMNADARGWREPARGSGASSP